jgi:hypothetical protein
MGELQRYLRSARHNWTMTTTTTPYRGPLSAGAPRAAAPPAARARPRAVLAVIGVGALATVGL